nr:MAG TPA: hypothetical protein [Inoviridae sp.]
MTELCESVCEVGPSRFFVVRSTSDLNGNGLITFDSSVCDTVIRSGGGSFGCPGDSLTAAEVGAPDGSVGVAGALPVSIQFREPVTVFAGGSGTVEVAAAESVIGVASTSTLLPSWTVAQNLGGVLVGFSALSVLALSLALAVRFVSRIRSAI